MKKVLVMVAAVMALTYSAKATVTLAIDAEQLKNQSGTAIPDGSGLVLIVADTLNNGFTSALNVGQLLSVGSLLSGGDDQILAKYTMGAGFGDGEFEQAPSLALGGNWNPGDGIAIYWFSDATTAQASLAGGEHYNLNASTKDANWVTPADAATKSMSWFTTDGSGDLGTGDVPAANGNASLVVPVVPEPSSMMLLGLGLLGMVGLIRRRS